MSSKIYKKVNDSNNNHVVYKRMCDLEVHKPYIVTSIESTHHDIYGPGLTPSLMNNKEEHYNCTMPRKYVDALHSKDVDILKGLISSNQQPFLVFRGLLTDNSVQMDLLPHCEELITAYNKWAGVEFQVIHEQLSDCLPTQNEQAEAQCNQSGDEPNDYLSAVFKLWNNIPQPTAKVDKNVDDLAAEVKDLLEANKTFEYEDDISISSGTCELDDTDDDCDEVTYE